MGDHAQEAPLLAGAIARGELTVVQSEIQLLRVLQASASLVVVNHLFAACLDRLDLCNKDTQIKMYILTVREFVLQLNTFVAD